MKYNFLDILLFGGHSANIFRRATFLNCEYVIKCHKENFEFTARVHADIVWWVGDI